MPTLRRTTPLTLLATLALASCTSLAADAPAGGPSPAVAVDPAAAFPLAPGWPAAAPLHAELLVNPGFEAPADAGGLGPGWSVAQTGNAPGSLALDTDPPLPPGGPHALKLVTTQNGPFGSRFAAANTGVGGIPVHAGEWYDVSFLARKLNGPGGPPGGAGVGVVFSLESPDGVTIATRTTLPEVGRGGIGTPVAAPGAASQPATPPPGRGRGGGGGDGWQRFTVSLHARKSLPNARLVLNPIEPGTLWFDDLSLAPRNTITPLADAERQALAAFLEGAAPTVAYPALADAPLYASAAADREHHQLFLQVFNTAAAPQTLPVRFLRDLRVGAAARCLTLPLADDPAAPAANRPAPAAPTDVPIPPAGWTYTFPARSCTLFRIPTP